VEDIRLEAVFLYFNDVIVLTEDEIAATSSLPDLIKTLISDNAKSVKGS
jgi:hypothetical protein